MPFSFPLSFSSSFSTTGSTACSPKVHRHRERRTCHRPLGFWLSCLTCASRPSFLDFTKILELHTWAEPRTTSCVVPRPPLLWKLGWACKKGTRAPEILTKRREIGRLLEIQIKMIQILPAFTPFYDAALLLTSLSVYI